jgi:hypothetical protein
MSFRSASSPHFFAHLAPFFKHASATQATIVSGKHSAGNHNTDNRRE